MFNIASDRAGRGIAKVQQLLGYSAVAVTVRYTHTNLDSKKAAVAKLESVGDNLVTVRTKMQQSRHGLSLKRFASYSAARS